MILFIVSTAVAQDAQEPTYAADVPEFLLTPDKVETDQKSAGLDSNSPAIKANDDGSYTVWFGPKAPEGHKGNWIQTMPGKSFIVILRLYGPLEPWFDKTWKPGDFELVK
jgi:hypothetical protein